MIKSKFASSSALLFSGLTLLTIGLSLAPLRAETIIKETFESDLTAAQWNIVPKGSVSAAEGVLTMTGAGPDSAYATSFIRTVAPHEGLNFTRNNVEIKLTDIAFKSDAAPNCQVFHLIIGSDSKEDTATARVHLRISADGTLSLVVADKNIPTPLAAYSGSVALPIKSLTIKLTKTGMIFAMDDANGPKEKEMTFTGPLTAWESALPYFRLQAQRNPGGGTLVVSVHGLTVDSTPAAK